jgi:IS5 family transposase
MLRIYCLQQWYNLSDPATEEALYDSLLMRRFAGVTSDADIIPDETTILRFRRLLERHELTAALFTEINTLLAERGLLVGKGTIVDATIIHAPSSTKNAQNRRDPEMHQTTKAGQWYFGMKVHTGSDVSSGLVHTLEATAARVHDASVMAQLLHGQERALYGDCAYQSKAAKAMAAAVGLRFCVNERITDHPQRAKQRLRNRRFSRVRAIAEHPFMVVKHLWGHTKVRYRGIAKNLAQMYALFGFANLYRVRKQLVAA